MPFPLPRQQSNLRFMPTPQTTEEQLQRLIAHWLEQHESVSTCESCTGGYIASQLTSHAGSSHWFQGALVTYQIELKERLACVPAATIEQYGVVSREVAEAMASGVRQACRSTIGIATTGVAGPAGGTAETPVGTVCIAIATPRGVRSERLQLTGSRQEIVRKTYCEIINRLYHLELK